MILILIGYKGTGKDTLFKILNKEIKEYHPWLIFNKDNDKFTYINLNFTRLAFADSLKDEVKSLYNIECSEENKDIKNININNELVSFRSLCINYGKNTLDKQKWVKIVCSKINNNTNYIITDLRFKHEIEYLKMFFDKNNIEYKTIRLFNSDINIPDKNIISEHELDDYKTNFLFLKKFEDKDKFTQYNNFNFCGKIF